MSNQARRLRYRWRNIRLPYKLLLVYMPLILLPALIGMYYLTNSYTSTSKVQTTEYTTDLLNLMGQKIDERLISYEKFSRHIMTDPEILELVSSEAATTYEKFQIQNKINEKINTIWLGADQNVYIRSILIETPENIYSYGKSATNNYKINEPDYMNQIASMKGGAIWFEPESFSDGFQEIKGFRLGRSIRNSKLKELGTLTVIIDARAITDLFEQTSLKNVSLKLLDEQEQLLLDNAVTISSEEQQLLTFSQERIHTGWLLSAEMPLGQLYEPIYRTAKIAGIIIMVCIVLGLVVTQLLAMDLVIPIRKLMRNMKQGIRGVRPERLNRFGGAIEIVEMNDTFISVMYEIEHLISEIGKQEHKKKEAEIRVLQNQLSPHFLYNTLNSIRWMAIIQNQENIKEMVDSLNRLLTYGLRGKDYTVTLNTDIEMLDNYVKIQRVRYQHFDLKKNIPASLENAAIPKFLLQPVIENALIHGLSQADRPGEITISASVVDANLLLVVTDNGIGMDADKVNDIRSSLNNSEQHFGFHSVNERVQLHYGLSYGLELTSQLGEGTCVTIKIPLQIHDS
ncbi:hypothetical protein BK133_20350 [Paenibacillus sp. FSL H8-0548]|uniref:sensor histidine kinase n=1 Tax=Paenibacillus sp. FSL H8-0548 TaxID=1920422 RepID=UPI00096CB639|nr:histidine kinase [Paenibacillus sp. FSL H8-0548]OMF26508.1 hypothetical protein BK133_20350 [Paenibacillus sp. FSL H8-0548]